MSRTLIFGDVHGCAAELRALVQWFTPRPGDHLISVGDLIKKGPDSAGVVRFLREFLDRDVGVSHVLGNHEGSLRTLVREGGPLGRDLRLFVEALTEEELDWLLAAPILLPLEEHGALILHGGVLPSWTDLPPAETEAAERLDPERMDLVLRLRNLAGPSPRRAVTRVRRNGERGRTQRMALDLPLPTAPSGGRLEVEEIEVPLHSFLGLREIGAGDPNWPTLYDGRFGHIYFGHQPFLASDTPVQFPHATALDLGCVYGGALAAVVLEAGKEPILFSVKAEREYSKWGF